MESFNKKHFHKKRYEIETIDKNILLLLVHRFETLKEIKKIKKQLHIKIYDKKRESILIKKALNLTKKSQQKKVLMEIYKNILSQSLNYLLKKKKAF